MSPLLSLPLELRDKILGFVILSTIVAPPESPNNADDRERLKDTKYYGWSAGCRVLYQKDTQFQGIPTLAINRQLRRETLDIMSLMQLPSLRFYKLDVMIVEERTLWPTWLYIPTTTSRVEEVRSTFRIMGAAGGRRSGYDGGDGGPPVIVWAFFNLLERFLQVGPVSRQNKPHDKPIKIRHIILDVLTPNVPADMIGPDIRQNRLKRLRKQSGINYLKNPRTVLAFIMEYLGFLEGSPGGEIASVAYEKLGKITFMVDGVMVRKFIATKW